MALDIEQDKELLHDIIDEAVAMLKRKGLLSSGMEGKAYGIIEDNIDEILEKGVKSNV